MAPNQRFFFSRARTHSFDIEKFMNKTQLSFKTTADKKIDNNKLDMEEFNWMSNADYSTASFYHWKNYQSHSHKFLSIANGENNSIMKKR